MISEKTRGRALLYTVVSANKCIGNDRIRSIILGIPAVVQWVKDLASLWWLRFDPQPGWWVKDPVLLQLWCRLQLWLRFNPWLGNFHVLWVAVATHFFLKK